jgi:single-stranded DNA-binding protein
VNAINDIPVNAVGHLVSEPNKVYRKDGVAVTTVTVEVVQRRLTTDGWKRVGSTRLTCRAWAGLAEHIFDSLGSGDRVVVIGHLRQRPLTGGGYVYEVVLDDLGPSLVFSNAMPVAADPVRPQLRVVPSDESA